MIINQYAINERERAVEAPSKNRLTKIWSPFFQVMFLVTFFLSSTSYTFASTTSGTIDSTNRYAWSENAGWIDFGTTLGAVSIADSALSGYAYSENSGWISLNCSNTGTCTDNPYQVANNAEGILSGYAWSENSGWVNFAPTNGGVTISSSGVFSGYAYSESSGWINFTTDHPVTTDWRPASSRMTIDTPVPNSGTSVTSSSGSRVWWWPWNANTPTSTQSTIPVQPAVQSPIVKPKPKPQVPIDSNNIVDVTRPFSGVTSLFKYFTLSLFSRADKEKLPSEVVFAKPANLPSYDVSTQVSLQTSQSNTQATIHVPQGKPIDLAVKADKPVKEVLGYLTIKKIDRRTALLDLEKQKKAGVNTANLASILAALETIPEDKFVLLAFKYTDPDGDGIYTATIDSPKVTGEYDIMTILEYKDTKLGFRELHLTAVIDPEGYVYEKISAKKEARIIDATVSIFWKNPETSSFELWDANKYKQVNPQKTDITGMYSFLVPEGTYKLKVTASGYSDYIGAEFQIVQGAGVHENIELKTKHWWTSIISFFANLIH